MMLLEKPVYQLPVLSPRGDISRMAGRGGKTQTAGSIAI
jgi:hypothetical protein